jgi:hypothetical protein
MGLLELLLGVIVAVHYQINTVFLNPSAVHAPRSIGEYFIDESAPIYGCNTLVHRKYGSPFIVGYCVIGMDTHQDIVALSSGFL